MCIRDLITTERLRSERDIDSPCSLLNHEALQIAILGFEAQLVFLDISPVLYEIYLWLICFVFFNESIL